MPPMTEDHVFHSSMQLYVLVESRPKPDRPDWVEVSCIRRGDTEYMQVFPSRIDARIEQHSLSRRGTNYQVAEFHRLNPWAFIDSHDGRLNVCVIYAFAAHAGRLMADPVSGSAPLGLALWQSFGVPVSTGGHFGVEFGEMHDLLGRLYVAAGLPSQARTLQELASYAPIEIDRIAEDARRRMVSRIRREAGTEYAIYDVNEQRWRFTGLKHVQTQRLS